MLPHQVGQPEVMPGQAQYLPGLRTSRPPNTRVRPQQVGVAEVVPGQVQHLPGPSTSEHRVRPPQMGLADPGAAEAATDVASSSSETPASGVFLGPAWVEANRPRLWTSCMAQLLA